MKHQYQLNNNESPYIQIPSPTGMEVIIWAKNIGQQFVEKELAKNSNSESKGPGIVKTLNHKPPVVVSGKPSESEVENGTKTRKIPSFEEMFRHRKPVLYTDIKVKAEVPPEKAAEASEVVTEAVLADGPETAAELETDQKDFVEVVNEEETKVEPLFEPPVPLPGVQPLENIQQLGITEVVEDAADLEANLVSTLNKTDETELLTEVPQNREIPEVAESEECEEIEPKPEGQGLIKQTAASYQLPAQELLSVPPKRLNADLTEDVIQRGVLLEETLANFGVKVQVVDFCQGPAITRYELQPAPGVKVSRIVGLADDIALSLAAPDVRIEAPVPGKAVVGIEVPNDQVEPVYFQEVTKSNEFVQAKSPLVFALGKDIGGAPVVADLVKMPHLLIAGSTGSGKSVCMNALIASMLFRARPDQVKFLMIDPKMVELSNYNGIPHLISPVITDPKKATAALRWVISEMENRYNLFAGSGARNLAGYNQKQLAKGEKPLPLIVVVIDELADLMMVASRDVEDAICRLAQMARAAGIHLVIATQRPSVDVITGIIKANIPSRIAFAVSSQVDSRTILDMAGAEKLLGRGDMLFYPTGMSKPLRVQGAFVSDSEIEQLVNHLKSQGKPEYLDGVTSFESNKAVGVNGEEDDELFSEAANLVIQSGQASVSFLQRRLRVGYARAARLIDLLEDKGIVGGYEGSKPREVLVSQEEWEILAEDFIQ